jgi:osmotically-inducible protein OsmY
MLSTVSVMKPPRFSSSDNVESAEYSPAVIALGNSSYTGIRRIRCSLRDGVARLEGRLATYHQKQLAQEIVRRTEGVDVVENYIVVESQG